MARAARRAAVRGRAAIFPLALKIPDKGTEKAGDLEERGSEPREKPKREDMVVLQAAPRRFQPSSSAN